MHPFRQFIQNYTTLTPADWALIESCLSQKEYNPNDLILEEGKVCSKIYFLESGLLRYFTWNDGIDMTKFFTQPPYCFTSQRSYNLQIPSAESIEVLEKSIVWEIARIDAERLFKLASWSTFVRKLIQEVQFFTQEIMEALQSQTAEQRYRQMLHNNDPLLQKVPLKHLASYLGIAPQSLSRIRKKMLVEFRT